MVYILCLVGSSAHLLLGQGIWLWFALHDHKKVCRYVFCSFISWKLICIQNARKIWILMFWQFCEVKLRNNQGLGGWWWWCWASGQQQKKQPKQKQIPPWEGNNRQMKQKEGERILSGWGRWLSGWERKARTTTAAASAQVKRKQTPSLALL